MKFCKNQRFYWKIISDISILLEHIHQASLERTNKPNNLFPLLCQAANQNGNYLYKEGWNRYRDYIHVQDLAEGHVAA